MVHSKLHQLFQTLVYLFIFCIHVGRYERKSAIHKLTRNFSFQMLKATKLKKGVLPDINNEEFFPVLGSAKPEEVKKKRPEPGFEEVKHGGRVQRSSDLQTNAPVSIGNRFGSLADS